MRKLKGEFWNEEKGVNFYILYNIDENSKSVFYWVLKLLRVNLIDRLEKVIKIYQLILPLKLIIKLVY